jgi:ZIP family zinc transporter
LVYVAANALLTRQGAKHRKRSGGKQPSEQDSPGSGTAIAVGALLDGIPESVVLGLGLVAFITATAAGAILAMLADTMIPEAFEEHHTLTGLVAALGFLTAFTISQSGV